MPLAKSWPTWSYYYPLIPSEKEYTRRKTYTDFLESLFDPGSRGEKAEALLSTSSYLFYVSFFISDD